MAIRSQRHGAESCELRMCNRPISNFMCIRLNTHPNTQNACGLEVCIPIGFYVKVIFNKLVSFAPGVIRFTRIFLYIRIYHEKLGVSKYSGFKGI